MDRAVFETRKIEISEAARTLSAFEYRPIVQAILLLAEVLLDLDMEIKVTDETG